LRREGRKEVERWRVGCIGRGKLLSLEGVLTALDLDCRLNRSSIGEWERGIRRGEGMEGELRSEPLLEEESEKRNRQRRT